MHARPHNSATRPKRKCRPAWTSERRQNKMTKSSHTPTHKTHLCTPCTPAILLRHALTRKLKDHERGKKERKKKGGKKKTHAKAARKGKSRNEGRAKAASVGKDCGLKRMDGGAEQVGAEPVGARTSIDYGMCRLLPRHRADE